MNKKSQLQKLLAYHKKQVTIYRDFIAEPALKKRHRWAKRKLQKHEAFIDYLSTITNPRGVAGKRNVGRGVLPVQALNKRVSGKKNIVAVMSEDDADNLEWHELHDDMNEARRIGEIE